MNTNKMLAIAGVMGGLLVCAGAGLEYTQRLDQMSVAQREAKKLDRFRALVTGNPCSRVLKGVKELNRAISVGQSFNLGVIFENGNKSDCSVDAEMQAAGFDVAPSQPVALTLAPGETQRSWNLSAKHPGDHVVAVRVGAEQLEVGFRIVDGKLVPDWLLLVASIASVVFGPALSIPWWLEERRKRKAEKEKEELKAREEAEAARRRDAPVLYDATGKKVG